MRALAALLCLTAPAVAQLPLFELPGQVTWDEVPEAPAQAFMVDPGGMHYVRSESDDAYVHCRPDGDPNHPDAVRDFGRVQRGFRSQGLLVRAADRSAVYAIEQRSLGEFSLRVVRLDCRAPDPERQGEEILRATGAENPFAELVRSERMRQPVAEQRPDGRLCLAGFGGMSCFDPQAEAPAPQLVVDTAALVEAEPTDPYFIARDGALEPSLMVDRAQLLHEVVPGPDGRLMFQVRRLLHWADAPAPERFEEHVLAVHQLFELTADDEVLARSPQFVPDSLTPLRPPTFYWPQQAAWVTRPVAVWQYSDGRPANGGQIPTGGGWGGEGLLLFRADQSGFGYAPMARAQVLAHDCTQCSSEIPESRLLQAADGALHVSYRAGLGAPTRTYAINLNPDRLDLDDDGLTRAEEATLGTDPNDPDSDGGGTSDRDEVHLWGTDPTDPGDDFVRGLDPMGFGVSQTGLIKLRLPDVPDGTRYGWGTLTGMGPLCVDTGACYGPDGRVVAQLPPNPAVVAFNSLDGEHLFYWDGSDLRARNWVTGADQHLARAVDLPAQAEGQPVVVVPVDDRRAWVADVERVVFMEATPGDPDAVQTTELLNLRDARQAVGLLDRPRGAVNSQILRGLLLADLDVLGYHHESDRLVVSVAGAYENWVLTVPRDGPAQVIRTARQLLGLRHDSQRAPLLRPERYPRPGPPYALRRIGGGAYLSLRGAFRLDLQRGPHPVRADAFTGVVAWGGVGLRHVDQASGTFFPGWTAYVGLRPVVEPGDLLWFVNEDAPDRGPRGVPYKSGTQGGFVRLLNTPVPEFGRVVGADRHPDGRLCVVNHLAQGDFADRLAVFDPDGSGDGVPIRPVFGVDEPGLRDCAWDGDGTLWALLDNPPRRAVVDLAEGRLRGTPLVDFPPSAEMLRFVRLPTGGLEVFHTATGARGLAYGPSGRRLELTAQNVLEIDGVAVTAPLQLVYDDRDRIDEVDPQIALFADLVERPDGLVVIHPFRVELQTVGTAWFTRHWVVDPATGRVAELGVGDHQVLGGATVRVPGGEARDPWTGEPLTTLPGLGGAGVEPPDAPEAPTGGMQVPQRTSEEGGCRAVPGPTALGHWALLLCLGLRRRDLRRR